VAAINPLGFATTSVNDAASRLVATVDALANRTSFGFDAGGRQVQQ